MPAARSATRVRVRVNKWVTFAASCIIQVTFRPAAQVVCGAGGRTCRDAAGVKNACAPVLDTRAYVAQLHLAAALRPARNNRGNSDGQRLAQNLHAISSPLPLAPPPFAPPCSAPCPSQTCAGLSYSFSLYGPALKERLGLSQVEIATVGSAGGRPPRPAPPRCRGRPLSQAMPRIHAVGCTQKGTLIRHASPATLLGASEFRRLLRYHQRRCI